MWIYLYYMLQRASRNPHLQALRHSKWLEIAYKQARSPSDLKIFKPSPPDFHLRSPLPLLASRQGPVNPLEEPCHRDARRRRLVRRGRTALGVAGADERREVLATGPRPCAFCTGRALGRVFLALARRRVRREETRLLHVRRGHLTEKRPYGEGMESR